MADLVDAYGRAGVGLVHRRFDPAQEGHVVQAERPFLGGSTDLERELGVVAVLVGGERVLELLGLLGEEDTFVEVGAVGLGGLLYKGSYHGITRSREAQTVGLVLDQGDVVLADDHVPGVVGAAGYVDAQHLVVVHGEFDLGTGPPSGGAVAEVAVDDVFVEVVVGLNGGGREETRGECGRRTEYEGRTVSVPSQGGGPSLRDIQAGSAPSLEWYDHCCGVCHTCQWGVGGTALEDCRPRGRTRFGPTVTSARNMPARAGRPEHRNRTEQGFGAGGKGLAQLFLLAFPRVLDHCPMFTVRAHLLLCRERDGMGLPRGSKGIFMAAAVAAVTIGVAALLVLVTVGALTPATASVLAGLGTLAVGVTVVSLWTLRVARRIGRFQQAQARRAKQLSQGAIHARERAGRLFADGHIGAA